MLEYKYNNFYEMIKENAKNFPKKPVVFIDKRKVGNLRLKQKIDTFARFLEFSGIKGGDKVALIVENSEEFLISFFAVTKIGAIVVPINTFLKKDEYEYIVNDCEAKLLVSSPKFSKETKGLIETTGVEKIVWTGDYKELDEKNYSFLEIAESLETHEQISKPPTLEDTACIVYTSGTTGKPKGAMLSYKNIFSNLVAINEIIHLTQKDRFVVYLPMFHSFTLTTTVLLPFYSASSIVIVKSIFPFSNVLKQVLLKRVTIFLGIPTVYNALIKAKVPWYFMWFNKIRVFVSGGAPLSEKVLEEFKVKFPKATLLEGYGLSECSPVVAVNRLDKQKPLSVGPALPGYEVKAVDEEMLELPTGEVGELIVKGDCVMQGYYKREDATKETIVNGWLRTGDLVKIDEDGFIFIMDRKKDLIISKGINIYPREIEELLYQLDEVDAAAVIGQKNDATGDEVPVAFVVLKDEAKDSLSENDIKKYLKNHLANFKVPKNVYFVDELPKNATGKVLKRVLKDMVREGKI